MRIFRPTANRRFNELVGLLILVFATLLLLALLSYAPTDPSWDTAAAAARPRNWVGPVGAFGADLLFQVFGVATFLFVLALAIFGRQWFRPQSPLKAAAPPSPAWPRLTGLLLCVGAVGALLAELPRHLTWRTAVPLEGTLGVILAGWLTAAFNPIGGAIVTVTLLLVGVFLATTFSFAHAREHLSNSPALARLSVLAAPWRRLQAAWIARRTARQERRAARQAEASAALHEERSAAVVEPKFIPARNRPPRFEDASTRARRELELAAARKAAGGESPLPAPADAALADLVVQPMAERVLPAKPLKPPVVGAYKLPSAGLLQEPSAGEKVNEEELRRLAGVLKSKCDEFDVRGQITQINPGPVVTTYEFKPEAGIKYSRITALTEDLCLALEAESIYIERIPGKSTVGIEIPNRKRETIYLREVVESEEFHAAPSRLTMALGRDSNGHIVTADLAAMPHLLIAGSTGSGKSVALNTIIVSLLYKSTPDQVRFILVDPKRLELGLYDGIPHLFTPIITEPKLAANALRNATREMERRLKLLATRGVRNIAQYNKLFEDQTPGLFDQLDGVPEADRRPLPYIVIIIDELADLMIVDSSNVEESITRLAQMARAVGIHLILATQRPSVDVITGLIKANFPARMSFRVATKIDSRTILDAPGAESLLGKGDMLLLPPGTSRLHRIHGAFLTEKEIAGVVEFWRKQGAPQLEESFLKAPPEEGNASEPGQGNGDPNDPLYEEAVRVVMEYGKASTSLLQRRLRVGYGRAAHLVDLMYADGIVGPADGPKPRELLKSPDWIREVDEALK